jgi:hypothetical protein
MILLFESALHGSLETRMSSGIKATHPLELPYPAIFDLLDNSLHFICNWVVVACHHTKRSKKSTSGFFTPGFSTKFITCDNFRADIPMTPQRAQSNKARPRYFQELLKMFKRISRHIVRLDAVQEDVPLSLESTQLVGSCNAEHAHR